MEQYSQAVWALVLNLLSFNITHVKKELNSMADRLAVFATSPNQQLSPHRPECVFQPLYHPYIPDHLGFWEAIPDDDIICAIIQDEPLNPKETISMENNKIPEGLIPLEISFSWSVRGNKEEEEDLQLKVVEAISMDIRTLGPSLNVKINVQGSDKEGIRSTDLLGGFQEVFSWFNMDLHGFDPGLVHHTVKPARQKQRLVSSTLKETFRGKLKIFLRNEMFFLVHPKWVSNLHNIKTCISLRTFKKSIMRNHFPPLNMKMFLQQVVELHLEPLLDSLFGYDKIKVEGINIHKTTFTTNCDTMPYN
jgi:hypothetical protein